jgi:hypothetical protein
MDIHISTSTHVLEHDYPAQRATRSLQDEQLLLRAVEAFRFFYPSVSAEGIFNGGREAGVEDGKALMILSAGPRHVAFTANSDTPYASGVLDLVKMGPVVIEIPPGPFIGLVDDHHQRWIVDMGIPGPDAGRGGRYLVLPPDFEGTVPDGYYAARSSTYKALIALRAMPQGGDVRGALDALRQVKVYSLATQTPLAYVDLTDRAIDATLLRWEGNLEFWRKLHAIIDEEPVLEEYRPMYGALATLGIRKGMSFEPDARMQAILETAATIALDEMRVEAFASERPDRIVWNDRQWEWIGLVPDDANFETKNFLDLEARDRWFFQAIVASPAMFRRTVGGGSVYWLAARDQSGAYLDGGRSYKLTVPQPVPASLFWSVTAYDAKTRSQVVTPQDKAVLGSLNDELEPNADGEIELYFGPTAPPGKERQWIQTAPDHGYFLYVRIYGPQQAALDGSWKPSDMTLVEEVVEEIATKGPEATEIPASITTPSTVETRLGTFEFPLGVATEDTAARVYDQLDFIHAVETFTNALPAVSLVALREGMRGAGIEDNQVLLFSELMDSRSLFLTANCDTVYFISFLDLTSGPLVLEVPPGSLGIVDDMWFRWVTDFGMAGPDRGEGGRYLVLPPDYAGTLPEGGCFVARARTNHVTMLGRMFLVDGEPGPAVARIKQHLKIYPYTPGTLGSSIAGFLAGTSPFETPTEPPETVFVEGTGLAINTIPPNDVSFFDMLDAVVQLEPASALEPEIAGHFAAIGIEKDILFRPDDRRKRILGDAIAFANAAARSISTRPREEECFGYYGTDSAWFNPLFVGGYDFSQPPPVISPEGVEPFPDPHARALAARTSFFYVATGITPAMCMRMPGVGSQYLVAFEGADNEALDGASSYTVTLPPEIPAEQFWSLTLYDNQTRSMLQTEQRYPRAGSQDYPSPAAVASADGTTTIHFAPTCPEGVARGNWIETVPGVGYFVILRLYGPHAGFFDRTWRPSEIERVR